MAEILLDHIEALPKGTELLFPFYRGGAEVIRTAGNYNPIYRALRSIEKACGAVRRSEDGAPAVTLRGLHTFRHTYATAMLQTVDDHGAPVAIFSVAALLGHKSISMLEETYAHIDREKNRKPNLEYRVEACTDLLGDRLTNLSPNLSPCPSGTPNGQDPTTAGNPGGASSFA